MMAQARMMTRQSSLNLRLATRAQGRQSFHFQLNFSTVE